MAKKLEMDYDDNLLYAISADFDLRQPNSDALEKLVHTLANDYEPEVMQVVNLATGVGKTYLMVAFVEYLRSQGIYNVVIVTPGKIVQKKTEHNFTPGYADYIKGAEVPPEVVTPQDYSAWIARQNGSMRLGRRIPMLAFIFNIQQLIAPKVVDGDTHGDSQDAQRRRPRTFDESAGVLFDYLRELDNLVVIADESHLYSPSAAAFNAALKELEPAAIIGLTASVMPEDHVIYKYPLYRAIQDKYVKAPVLAFRKGGYGTGGATEEQQLRDAIRLRAIKQAYYDAYAQTNGKTHLNAVVFVVCADVEHATQVAELLRTGEYFNDENAVLQVDSKHDDERTQALLENLDKPESPVLAVVSVNKLKEGWDVKNIAVVVTLRAMASEVLTQQTMGRGLRLPFGKYTGVTQIDQLDIIAHQSFKELLEAENVLSQFGLEEAVAEGSKEKVSEAISKAAEAASGIAGRAEDNTASMHDSLDGGEAEVEDATEGELFEDSEEQQEEPQTVTVRPIPEAGITADPPKLEIIKVETNPRFDKVLYYFPVTDIKQEEPKIDLAEITEQEISRAAERVTSTGDVLYRKEIIAALGKKLQVTDTESAEVESLQVEGDEARRALVTVVLKMSVVPSTVEVRNYLDSYLIPQFMKKAKISTWTEKSLNSACRELHDLISAYIDKVQRAIKFVSLIYPKKIKAETYQLPLDEKIYEPVESRAEFVPHRMYNRWNKSLYQAESFDSYSGEYVLAKMLDTSPHIVWWHRLHRQYGAYIYYTSKDKYFPDFVALDDNGVHWIIEGKDKRGRDDAIVQKKREKAEMLVRILAANKKYIGQKWGYLIAYEDDIEQADGWNDLKIMAHPVSNDV